MSNVGVRVGRVGRGVMVIVGVYDGKDVCVTAGDGVAVVCSMREFGAV